MPRILAAIAVLAALAAGCSDKKGPGTTTSSIDVTGTWTGSLTVLGTATTMTWTLTQRDTNVTGPVLLSLPSGTVLLNGSLTGALSGTTLTYTIAVGAGNIPSQPTCTGQIGGTMAVTTGATPTMSGTPTVTGSNCTPPFPGGPITLTRR